MADGLGVSDLVERWIDLHVVGARPAEVRTIAQEAGYVAR